MINKLKEFLPSRMITEIEKTISKNEILEEIRIRCGRQAYMILSGKNILLNIIATNSEMQEIMLCISKNSLYAFRDTIINGYITIENGIRIGIIGRAGVENGKIIGIYEVSEFAIRIPNYVSVDCSSILDIAKDNSLLIFSPPGEGKTTLLRAMIKSIGSGFSAKRVGVIDSRAELLFGLDEKSLLISLLVGYPRRNAIEIAVRTMNPQIIVCDEIGDTSDADAIIMSQGAGIPIIATCHGRSLPDIFSHNGIRNLHKAHIFDYYVRIKRAEKCGFEYSINSWGEANDYF